MSASICINFGGGTVTSDTVEVGLSNCTLDANQGQSVALALAATTIMLSASRVTIGTDGEAPLNGSCVLTIDWSSGNQPAITVSGMTGSNASVTWPTAAGPASKILAAGIAMPLTGIVGSQ